MDIRIAREEGLLTSKMEEKLLIISERYDECPKSISYDGFLNVVFVEYSFGIIGIEKDGYSHM